MTTEQVMIDPAQGSSRAPSASPAPKSRRAKRGRSLGSGQSLLAQGEPIVWLIGAGLVICVVMIIGLLGLVIYQGGVTFWPSPIVQLKTVDDQLVMGEVTRRSTFSLDLSALESLSGAQKKTAGRILRAHIHEALSALVEGDRLISRVEREHDAISQSLLRAVRLTSNVRDASKSERSRLTSFLQETVNSRIDELASQFESEISQALEKDDSGDAVFALYTTYRSAGEELLAIPDPQAMLDQLSGDSDTLEPIWARHAFSILCIDVNPKVDRRLIRTGNFEITNERFRWVNDYEIVPDSEVFPEWALLIERQKGGPFYGTPKSIVVDGEPIEADQEKIWRLFEEHYPDVMQRRQESQQAKRASGEASKILEKERLSLKRIELEHGADSTEWKVASEGFEQEHQDLEEEFRAKQAEHERLDEINSGYQLTMETAEGVEASVPLADIVRAVPSNQLTVGEKIGVYLSRWGEFLLDEPRNANMDGGVFPAIWCTVALTLLMTVVVVPFGVLAALYLREYAKAGLIVSTVRIAINNLAGVPSIVFGVFGLGFFCLFLGGSIDQMFYSEKLPTPTFGTGGIGWASLTLALLTLPVVIVATEEALAAVPRSMREGSLACGATRWQTIRRIVLPRAMPGIMTGAILAMARGAGEVAPLMIVGAVKIAPHLPVDGEFPYVHLERSFLHLGFHIFDLGFQSPDSEAARPMVFTTTLLLITIIALMNLTAIWLRGRLRKKFEYSQF